nr:hypothetical protein [Micromonospora sp. CB01531]
MTLTQWATMSCSSRAMRARSSASAAWIASPRSASSCWARAIVGVAAGADPQHPAGDEACNQRHRYERDVADLGGLRVTQEQDHHPGDERRRADEGLRPFAAPAQ